MSEARKLKKKVKEENFDSLSNSVDGVNIRVSHSGSIDIQMPFQIGTPGVHDARNTNSAVQENDYSSLRKLNDFVGHDKINSPAEIQSNLSTIEEMNKRLSQTLARTGPKWERVNMEKPETHLIDTQSYTDQKGNSFIYCDERSSSGSQNSHPWNRTESLSHEKQLQARIKDFRFRTRVPIRKTSPLSNQRQSLWSNLDPESEKEIYSEKFAYNHNNIFSPNPYSDLVESERINSESGLQNHRITRSEYEALMSKRSSRFSMYHRNTTQDLDQQDKATSTSIRASSQFRGSNHIPKEEIYEQNLNQQDSIDLKNSLNSIQNFNRRNSATSTTNWESLESNSTHGTIPVDEVDPLLVSRLQSECKELKSKLKVDSLLVPKLQSECRELKNKLKLYEYKIDALDNKNETANLIDTKKALNSFGKHTITQQIQDTSQYFLRQMLQQGRLFYVYFPNKNRQIRYVYCSEDLSMLFLMPIEIEEQHEGSILMASASVVSRSLQDLKEVYSGQRTSTFLRKFDESKKHVRFSLIWKEDDVNLEILCPLLPRTNGRLKDFSLLSSFRDSWVKAFRALCPS